MRWLINDTVNCKMCLFVTYKNSVSSSEHMASKGKVICELKQICKKRSLPDLRCLQFLHLSRGREENHRYLSLNFGCPDRIRTGYKLETLHLKPTCSVYVMAIEMRVWKQLCSAYRSSASLDRTAFGDVRRVESAPYTRRSRIQGFWDRDEKKEAIPW
jgi:hypothetical protein